MEQKVAEYIADFFAEHNMKDCFMITGGGAMHLNDAIGNHKRLRCIFNHHEQASAMGAEAYARVTGRMAPVCVTSGPGGTNTLTGVMGAWVDSIPMFVVSGQVKRETTIYSNPELDLRQLGDQEFNIVSAARTMCKYAAVIDRAEDTAYHLEKAYHLALAGRMGPVWLDVPLDIQAAIIDSDELRHFDPEEEEQTLDDAASQAQADTASQDPAIRGASARGTIATDHAASCAVIRDTTIRKINETTITEVLDKIRSAKAPAFLLGSGVRLSGAAPLVEELSEKFKVPLLVAWNSNDLAPYDSPYFCGMPGTVGTRPGNFTLQNADLLISLGCRMNIRMIGYEHYDFAKNAEMIAVDIDENELKKHTLKIDFPIAGDVKEFMEGLLSVEYDPPGEAVTAHKKWLSWTRERMEKYPACLPEYHSDAGLINPYVFIDKLFDHLPKDINIACGNGSACVITFQGAKIKKGQRMFTNSGCATMGYGLPASIGAAVATATAPTIAIEGDGSIMMNLQELSTIAHNKLDIHVFIINNGGYHSMRQTQRNLFDGRFLGIDEQTGISFPSFSKIAEAFSLPYYRIDEEKECNEVLDKFLAEAGPGICEVMVDPGQDFAPKTASCIRPDGSMESATLDDMAPFLSREEYEENKYEI